MQEDEVEASVGDLPLNVSEHQTKVRNQICVIPPSKRKSKKKKKKNKADSSSKTNLKDEKSLDAILEDLSIGPSPPTHQTSPQSTNVVSAEAQRKTQSLSTSSVLTVDPKFLKAENELRKIFGSKVVNSFENHQSGGSSRQIHGGRRAAHNPRKTLLISPSSHWPRWDWSMSMELLETKDGVNYFR